MIYIGLVALNAKEPPSMLIAISDNEFAVTSAVRLYINTRYGDGEHIETDAGQSVDFTHKNNWMGYGYVDGIVHRVEDDETWRYDDAIEYAYKQRQRDLGANT